jgi:hypothetical protein
MFVSSPTMPLSGPIYFIPLYAVVGIVGAAELLRLWSERRRVARWLVVAMVVTTVPVAINRIDVNRRISESQLPWKNSSAAVPPNSLVFVWQSGDYLMFLNPYSVNRPDIDGPVIYAADRGAENLNLIAAYPHRHPYLQQTSNPPDGQVPNDHPQTPRITLRPIRLHQGREFALTTTASGRTRGLSFFAFDQSGQPMDPRATTDRSARYRIRVGNSRGTTTGVGTTGTGTITIGLGRGATAASAARHPVFRQAVRYRVADGQMVVMTPIDSYRRVTVAGKRRWAAVSPGVASPVSLATRVAP